MKNRNFFSVMVLLYGVITTIVPLLIGYKIIKFHFVLLFIFLLSLRCTLVCAIEWYVHKHKCNKRHPERRGGEVFYCNVSDGFNIDLPEWNSKRLGEKAFHDNGDEAQNLRPIFIQRNEVEKMISKNREKGIPSSHLKGILR